MSGRIRSIKPELLEDAKTARLTDRQWRLFLSLFLLADDHGNLHGDVQRIDGAVFWGSSDTRETAEKALEHLASISLITRYSVRGQPYIAVNGWAKHQRVDKPSKPRVPGPSLDDGSYIPETLSEVSRDPRVALVPDLRSPTTDLRPPSKEQELPPAPAHEPVAPKAEPPLAAHSRPQEAAEPIWTAETQALRFRSAFEASQATIPGMGGQHVGRFHADVLRTAQLQGRDPADLFGEALTAWLSKPLSETERRAPYACFQSAWGDLTARGTKAGTGDDKGDTVPSLRAQAERALASGNMPEVKRLMARVKEIESEQEGRRGRR